MINNVIGRSDEVIHDIYSLNVDPCRSPPIRPVMSTGMAITAKYTKLLTTTAFVNGIARVNRPILDSSAAANVTPMAIPEIGASKDTNPISIYSHNRPMSPYERPNNTNVRIRKTDLLRRGMSVFLKES